MTETLRFPKKHTLLLLAFFTVHSLFSQTIRYVNAGLTTGLNNGTNWANAYNDLQAALAAAQTGDTICVAKGAYYPTTSTTDRTASFVMKNNVAIYGGFAGNETVLGQRDWKTNVTTLSGDIDRATDPLVVTGSGGSLIIAGYISNSYNVITNNKTPATSLNNTAILDGFTISGGYSSDNSFSNQSGGGMYNYYASPRITNVIFSGNSAANNGGGMFNLFSSPSLLNVFFSGNKANAGGGICNNYSSPSLTNCMLSANKGNSGGGMCNLTSSSPNLNSTIIFSNYGDIGGGMYNLSSTPIMTNCLISNNRAGYYGGGIYNHNPSLPSLVNCAVSGNNASSGGGIYNDVGSSVLKNCIVWGNSYGIYNYGSIAVITYSDVEGTGVYTGTGNNQDPRFVNGANPTGTDAVFGTADDGLALLATSPCINTGSNAAVPIGITTDIGGLPRIAGGTVDMGAYETQPSVLPLQLLDFNGNRQGNNNNLLQWTTANETGTKTFIVESSADGNGFTAIGNVGAMGIAKYSFIDINPLAARTYYRLKMIDADGMFTYSSIIWVVTNATNSASVYPNPVLHTTTLNINNNTILIGTQAILTDAGGRLIQVINIANNQEQLDMGMLPAGLYILKLENGGTMKIFKQ